MIEGRRPQVRGDALDGRKTDVDEAGQRLNAIDGLTIDAIAAERARRPRQLELDRRERLTEFVVQFPREVGAFFLARGLDASRKLPQLLLRFALPLFFIRDVGARSDVADQLARRPKPRRAVADDPAVLTVCPAQPVLEAERRPVLAGMLEMARQSIAILVVDTLPPAPSELVHERSPGESQPPPIEERTETVRFRDPQHDGRIVCDRTKKSVSDESRGVAHYQWFLQ